MIRYYVTDRRQGDIVAFAYRAVREGVDMIQVREKDLPDKELFKLVSKTCLRMDCRLSGFARS